MLKILVIPQPYTFKRYQQHFSGFMYLFIVTDIDIFDLRRTSPVYSSNLCLSKTYLTTSHHITQVKYCNTKATLSQTMSHLHYHLTQDPHFSLTQELINSFAADPHSAPPFPSTPHSHPPHAPHELKRLWKKKAGELCSALLGCKTKWALLPWFERFFMRKCKAVYCVYILI